MATVTYGIKGAIFKLALEHGKAPERFALTRRAYGRRSLPSVPDAPGSKLTMKALRTLVAAGAHTWATYSDWRRNDGVVGWIVGTDSTGADWICFKAPPPHELEGMRQEHMAKAAFGSREKAPPKTLVKSLVEAMRSGDLDTVKKLAPIASHGSFEEKARLYSSRFETKWPILEAAILDSSEMLEIILPHCDMEAVDEKGKTAIFDAIRHSKLANVKLLLDVGARVDRTDDDGMTPLMCAAYSKNRTILDLLLPHSDPNALDGEGNNALMMAISSHAEENVEALLPHTNLGTRDANNLTPLMKAVEESISATTSRNGPGQHANACAALLIRATSDVDATDATGNTALMRLISYREKFSDGHSQITDVAEMLINAGADVNRIFATGDSMLTHSARRGHDQYFDLLLPVSDVDHHGENGDTALILAAKKGNLKRVRQLAQVSDTHASNMAGQTPLLAVLGDQSELLSKSVDRILIFLLMLPLSELDAQDANGKTVVMELASGDLPEVLTLALPHSNPLLQDAKGRTALMHSIDASDECFKMLLPISDVLAQDHQGQTALMKAARKLRVDLVASLMSRSEVDRQDEQGYTALMHAAESRWGKSQEIFEILLRTANARLKSKEGKTASTIADKHTEGDVSNLLRRAELLQKETEELQAITGGGGKKPVKGKRL